VLITVLVAFAADALSGCKRPVVVRETRTMMGTVVSVELAGVPPSEAPGILKAVFAEAERLELIFSSYLPGSELNHINREAHAGPVRASSDMMAVLKRALEISRMTDGAFDVTVGPLMRVWKFFPEKKGAVPSESEVAQALQSVGWKNVELDTARGTVRLLRPGMVLDLAGIVQGYAADRMAAVARQRGVRSALINVGGDIYCLGERPGGGSWKIGLEHPRMEGQVLAGLKLRDTAVTTSGDYRNYFIHNKRRYSHIIDPRTGRPARTGVVEVCVIAPDCMTADALAKAPFIMGVEKGLKLLDGLDSVEGIIVAEEGSSVKMHFTRDAPKFVHGGQT
jgi:thiamine biosynthesis lipoprotein